MTYKGIRQISANDSVDRAELHSLVSDKILSDMKFRLKLDSIDVSVSRDIKLIEPTVLRELPIIKSNFYVHMNKFGRTKAFFDETNISDLKTKQFDHWQRLFSMDFDKSYVDGAVRIGLVHHRIDLPLFLYLAGYNRVLCDLTA